MGHRFLGDPDFNKFYMESDCIIFSIEPPYSYIWQTQISSFFLFAYT